MILARGKDSDEIWRMIHQDPFHTSGMAAYSVLEFDPVRAAPGLEGLLHGEG